MKKIGFVLGLVALATGCAVDVSTAEDIDVAGEGAELAAEKQAPKLNLSHIECTEDGDVLVHFVLLFAGTGTPGQLSGTYNGGTFGPQAASKNSGNVWHYNVILPSGDIEILTAVTTTSTGASVTLKNPGEYSGSYQCGAVEECPIVVEAQDVFCADSPLGNPGAECAAFGLLPQGKDDNLSGTSFAATQAAYVALVKSGNRGCGPGNSSYRVYVDVNIGDVLLTPVDQNISHVTYCACPEN